MAEKALVLLLNSNHSELEHLTKVLEREGYEIRGVISLAEFDELIRREGKVTVAVIDISGFDETVWDRCGVLYGMNISLLVVSPQRSTAVQEQCLKHGTGVLIKPITDRDLLDAIRSYTATG